MQEFAVNHNIEIPTDWAKVDARSFFRNGGSPILKRYGSIFRALQSIFPGKQIGWKPYERNNLET